MIHRSRLIILGLILFLFVVVAGWTTWNEYTLRRDTFLTGAPPEDVRTLLLPKTIDIAQMRPPALRVNDPIRYGDINSQASVIEFGDYECDGCKATAQAIRNVLPEYRGAVRFVWRDMPVSDKHPHAMAAAIFARCAGYQGKYWEAHDALLAAPELNISVFASIARQLGLTMDALDSCQNDPETQKAIEEDVKASRADGVNAIPFLFIGTQGFNRTMTESEIRDAIQAFLSS